MNERRKIHKVGEDLFVTLSGPRSLLIYREGMLPLRVELSDIELLVQALRAARGDLTSGTVSPDASIPHPDD